MQKIPPLFSFAVYVFEGNLTRELLNYLIYAVNYRRQIINKTLTPFSDRAK